MDGNEKIPCVMNDNDRTCAVIVTYNPELSISQQQIAALANQLNYLCVIDNGSLNQSDISNVVKQQTAFKVSDCLANEENQGIAAAQNQGIEQARQWGCDRVLILDQDSIPEPAMMAHLNAGFEQLKDQKISALGASYVEHGTLSNFVRFGCGRFKRITVNHQAPLVKTDFLISSGALMSLESITDIGLMDEGLFIDHVDTEWFLRARHKGYVSYGHCLAKMSHTLGEATQRIWLGRWRNFPIHKPFRYYYIFRNSLILFRRSYSPWQWRIADLSRLAVIFLVFGLLSKARAENLKMIAKGIVDGIKNRQGKLAK